MHGPMGIASFPAAATSMAELYAYSKADFKVLDSAYDPKLIFIIVAPLVLAYSTPSAIVVEFPVPLA